MANERRLADVDALKACINKRVLNGMIISWLFSIIDTCPTVDAVEVVRCGQCRYWTTEGNGYFEDEPYCGNPYGMEGDPKQDGFCSRGERRCD